MRSVRESDDCGEFGADYSGPAIALLNDANQLNHLSKPLPEYGSGQFQTVNTLPAQRQLTGSKRSIGKPILHVSG